MGLCRIMVAVDGSEVARHAYEIGQRMAERSGGCVATITVDPPERLSAGGGPGPEPRFVSPPCAHERRKGVPGIEITRAAEDWKADLLVLGRHPVAPDAPRMGATTNIVLRRRRGPTLLIPPAVSGFERILFALDGTERGFRILDPGLPCAVWTGGAALALLVLPGDTYDVPEDPAWRAPRRVAVEAAVAQRVELSRQGALSVRRGLPVPEILAHLDQVEAQMLVLGIRQGGPGLDPGSGHVARDLLQVAPTAVLAIPI